MLAKVTAAATPPVRPLRIHTLGAKMQRTVLSLAACALLAITVACAEQSATGPDIEARFLDVVDPASPPPPPPVDTLGAVLDEESSSTTYFGVTLFLNRTATSSWIMFDGDGATPDARLRIGADGNVRGTGELTLGGTQLALSSVTALISNTLKACETAPVVDEEIVKDGSYGKCGDVVVDFGERTVVFAIGVDTPAR
jgi:hypothetical protein